MTVHAGFQTRHGKRQSATRKQRQPMHGLAAAGPGTGTGTGTGRCRGTGGSLEPTGASRYYECDLKSGKLSNFESEKGGFLGFLFVEDEPTIWEKIFYRTTSSYYSCILNLIYHELVDSYHELVVSTNIIYLQNPSGSSKPAPALSTQGVNWLPFLRSSREPASAPHACRRLSFPSSVATRSRVTCVYPETTLASITDVIFIIISYIRIYGYLYRIYTGTTCRMTYCKEQHIWRLKCFSLVNILAHANTCLNFFCIPRCGRANRHDILLSAGVAVSNAFQFLS